jgi:hypothetical protein
MAIGNSRSISRREIKMLSLILLVFAFVLFVLAAWPIPSRVNLIAAGLACLVLAQLVPLLLK